MTNINGTGGNDSLGPGTLFGGNDSDLIQGFGGNDSLYGGAAVDTLYGGFGDDSLFGGTGADSLFGDQGNDTLFGGVEADRLYGGDGDDVFVETSASGDTDSIVGGLGIDTVDYSQQANAINANLATERVNPDGAGGNIDTVIGVENVIGSNAADSIIGDSVGNVLDGRDGNDSIFGGAGNDTLLGGAGIDSLSGDDGDDSILGEAGADSILGGLGNDTLLGGADADTLSGDDGNDSVLGEAGADSLLGGVGNDSLFGGSQADSLYGGAGRDVLDGGSQNDLMFGGIDDDSLSGGAGTDSLDGGSGRDTLTGGAGNDVLTGGVGSDTADYSGSVDPVNVNLNDAIAESGGDAQGDTLTGIENLIGSGGNDTLAGNSQANIIDGGAGADIITGNLGGDSINGGSGNDVIDAGPDTVSGAAPATPTNEFFDWTTGATGGIGATLVRDTGTMSVTANYTPGVGDGYSVNEGAIYSPETILGDNSGAFLSRPGAGEVTELSFNFNAEPGGGMTNEVSNVLFRISDIDQGGWRDSIRIFAYDELGNLVPVTLSTTTGDITLGGDLTNGYTAVATATAGNTNPDIAEGSILVQIPGPVSQIIIQYGDAANAGQFIIVSDVHFTTIPAVPDTNDADTVLGGLGDDSIQAGIGADSLLGEEGNDSLFGEAGEDTLDGGVDSDRLFGGAGNDSLAGGTGDDTLDGEADNDRLSGGDGNDSLVGGDGNDSLDGGANNDTLSGGNGNDSIIGGSGNDSINAGEGNDTVDAGAGNDTVVVDGTFNGVDTMDGGADIDTLVLDPADNRSLNVNMVTGVVDDGNGTSTQNFIRFENVTTDSGNDSVLGDSGSNVIITNAGNDSVSAGDGNDTIDGGAGNDRLFGEGGNDSIIGGSGNDSINAGEGNDTVDAGSGNDTVVVDGTFNGDDTMSGGADIDTLVLDPADDRNLNVNMVTGVVQDGQPGSQVFNLFENVTTADGNDSVLGDSVSNVIITNAGNDSVSAGDGNDTIDGGAGNDRLFGEAGNDSISGGAGDDTLSGGAGADVLTSGTGMDFADYSSSGAAVNITLNGLATGGDATGDTLSGIDGLIGSDFDDTMVGFDGSGSVPGDVYTNVFYGGLGNDILDGRGSGDSLFGGADNDTIIGGQGTDSLFGGTGNDVFDYANTDFNDSVNAEIVDGGGTLGAPVAGDFDTIDLTEYGWARVDIAYTGGDPASESGTITIFAADGVTIIGLINFTEIEQIIPCFTPGTMILTDRGEVAVETLRAGDLVMTRDNGLQPLRWVGNRVLSALDLQANPDLQPVRIARGALSGNGPNRTMLVSAQHRVLIEGARAELLFGEAEVLVPAKHLVGHADVTRAVPVEGVTYIHMLFDRHEILQSDGIWTESFQPAERMLSAMDEAVRAEVLALFPELAQSSEGFESARLSLKAHEARVLFAAQ